MQAIIAYISAKEGDTLVPIIHNRYITSLELFCSLHLFW